MQHVNRVHEVSHKFYKHCHFFTGETTVISEGIKNILDGMRKHGIKQITAVGVCKMMQTL